MTPDHIIDAKGYFGPNNQKGIGLLLFSLSSQTFYRLIQNESKDAFCVL